MTFNGPDEPESPSETTPQPVFYVDSGPAEATKQTPRHDAWTISLGIFGGVLLGTGLTLAVLGFTGVFEEPTPPTLPPAPTLTVPPPTSPPASVADVGSITEVAQRAIPSIVAVEVTGTLFEGGGSGVVYGSDGYVITNNHVVEDANVVSVVFSDGAKYPATIVGTDPLTDVAVIRVERSDLAPIDIGRSDALSIGDRAVAVGNPLILEGGPSVTSGIISALNRSLEVESGVTLYGLVQTDAPITRGSSGGALLDMSARLTGITTAIAVSDVGAEGVGFAIPIDLVIGVANDLIERGEVRHALLGISTLPAEATEGDATYPAGVLVTDLLDNSAYAEAGGQINDVIVSLEGTPVDSTNQLLTLLRRHREGDQVVVGVNRADTELELTVTLGRYES